MGKLFGTDGIRGLANVYPMDLETAAILGKAIVGHFKKSDANSNSHIVIGQDTRLSGDMLAHAVAAGVCSAGADAWLLGVLPTPGIARITVERQALAGVVISASHNPYDDNGLKIFDAHGYKLTDDAETRLEANIRSGLKITLAHSNAIGRVKRVKDSGESYLAFLQKAAQNSTPLNQMTIAVDCANGATFSVAPELFRRLGATVIPLYCSPDGVNINDDCGSQYPQHLAHAVLDRKADVGLAFDGDGDRLIAVDEIGRTLSGDQIMAILAKDFKRRGVLKNNAVVSTIMSNMGFRAALHQMGIQHFAAQVGDRYVMQTMLEKGAFLGGEDSGHMILRDAHTTGDGLLAALRLLEAMQRSGQPLSELAKVMTVFPQELINVDVKSKPDLQTIPEIVQAIQHAESSLGDQGRVLVRYSGTQNKCRVMVEGPTKEQTLGLCQNIAAAVAKSIG
jgi:phosphoglucosamine mutase